MSKTTSVNAAIATMNRKCGIHQKCERSLDGKQCPKDGTVLVGLRAFCPEHAAGFEKPAALHPIAFADAHTFIGYLSGTLIPDLLASGHVETAKDFREAVYWIRGGWGIYDDITAHVWTVEGW
jgi:hypothetical protein